MKEKVVIIGAGPAGLTSAYELLDKSKDKYEVIILEAEDKVGGISKTVKCGNNLVDTGIHRFFSKDDRVINLWKKLLPLQGKPSYDEIKLGVEKKYEEGGPDPEKTDDVMLVRDRITRIYYQRKFFDYPISMKFETIKNLGFIQLVKAGFSYLKACIFKKKEDSLENFYINRFGKVLYSMFFEKYTEKVWGRAPSKISADWGSQRVKGISVMEVIKDMVRKLFKVKNSKNTQTSLIETFWYPKMGAEQIWAVMAREIENMGGVIKKNCKVENIKVNNGNIASLTYINNGKTYEIKGDYYISSMPLKNLIMGMGKRIVPKEIAKIAKGLPYREFMTVGLLVKKINLKNNTNTKTLGNVIPDSWIYVQEPDVKIGRLQIFNNWSPYLFENPSDIEENVLINLEYFCSENDKYWNMSDKDFINFAINEAVKINLINRQDIICSNRVKVTKAYPAYFDTYSSIDKLIKYLNTYDNLFCIGRNGQHRYNNMDHSMVTGMEAANNIMNNIKSKDNIWNVNVDKEYHEIKK